MATAAIYQMLQYCSGGAVKDIGELHGSGVYRGGNQVQEPVFGCLLPSRPPIQMIGILSRLADLNGVRWRRDASNAGRIGALEDRTRAALLCCMPNPNRRRGTLCPSVKPWHGAAVTQLEGGKNLGLRRPQLRPLVPNCAEATRDNPHCRSGLRLERTANVSQSVGPKIFLALFSRAKRLTLGWLRDPVGCPDAVCRIGRVKASRNSV